MKKLLCAMMCLILGVSAVGCAPAASPPNFVTVTFDLCGKSASKIESVTVEYGGRIGEPNSPQSAGWIFLDWYSSSNFSTETRWDFYVDAVIADMTLYAKWTEDIKRLEGDALSGDYVKWQGRTVYDAQEQKMNLYNTETGFSVRFVGKTLTAVVTTDNTTKPQFFTQLAVSVDNQIFPDGQRIEIGKSMQTVTLFSDETVGEHSVQMCKDSQPYDSANAVILIQTDGYFLPIIQEDKPKFLLIGGSGISGHGSIGNPKEARTTQNSSALYAFGYLTARMFDANYSFVSNSGWGIKYGYNQTAATRGKVNLLAALSSVGILKDQSLSPTKIDLSQFVPDIVIVNAGGNDYSSHINNLNGTAKDNAIAEFKGAVQEMCTLIVTNYPKTVVLWTMTHASSNGLAATSAINTLPTSIRSRVVVTEIAQVGDFGEAEGADGHAGVLTHIRICETLKESVEKYTPLKAVRENIVWNH